MKKILLALIIMLIAHNVVASQVPIDPSIISSLYYLTYPQPELPLLPPSKVAEVLKEAAKIPEPKLDNAFTVKARSYCLYKNRTKSGYKVHSGVIATGSKYRLGTKVSLWYGGKHLGFYTIFDGGDKVINNPNRDGTDNIDIWFADKSCQASRVFGVRKVKMQIIHIPRYPVTLYSAKKIK